MIERSNILLHHHRLLLTSLTHLLPPFVHLTEQWYEVSEGFFGWLGWEGWWTTFPKITVDQLVWGPIWNGCYIALLGLMKREGLGEIWQTVKGTSVSLVVSGLKLWPLAHLVTYGELDNLTEQ